MAAIVRTLLRTAGGELCLRTFHVLLHDHAAVYSTDVVEGNWKSLTRILFWCSEHEEHAFRRDIGAIAQI